MHIETLHLPAAGPAKGTVVLLHGVCFGAWYWEDNFLPWLAARGYHAVALSYRNHGNSAARGALRWRRIREYLADVHAVVQQHQGPIYLVGHSMGGNLVQRYLRWHPDPRIRKAVLLCTVPDRGIAGATWQVLRRYPLAFLQALATLSFVPVFNNRERASRLLFGPATPDQRMQDVIARMQDESFRAYLDLFLPLSSRQQPNGVPLLLIGGQADALITPASLQQSARRLQAPLVFFPGGHNLNLEPGWEAVAQRVVAFFEAE
ncbi:MAG TPA: alpha/beta fold hydrolase [Lacibacter sp.]|nr:alpha/beta fold hydrolase [Lacibacter sp.]HMO88298.1 alpha/beta fold hydrolase [Lacibacter sp.]HMP87603.1 alpha/beta fold hydrolase [Lacibacter sp.]